MLLYQHSIYIPNTFHDASTTYSIQSTICSKSIFHQFIVVQSQIRISSITNCQSGLTFKGRTAEHYLNAFSSNNKRQTKTLHLSAHLPGLSPFPWTFWYWGGWKHIIQLTAMRSLSNSNILPACAFHFRIQYLFFAKEMPKCSNTWSMKHFKKSAQKILFCSLIMFVWFKISLCFKNITLV